MLTHARLLELLHYDPETGAFTRLTKQNNRVKCGEVINPVPHKSGYIYIRLDYVKYLAHRLAWFYVHGEWPKGDLDHRDLNKTNQRLSNLRPATDCENGYNKTLRSDNSSGYKGVSIHTQTGQWHARISVGRKRKSLGLYKTAKLAHSAYCKAAKEMHGEFARTS